MRCVGIVAEEAPGEVEGAGHGRDKLVHAEQGHMRSGFGEDQHGTSKADGDGGGGGFDEDLRDRALERGKERADGQEDVGDYPGKDGGESEFGGLDAESGHEVNEERQHAEEGDGHPGVEHEALVDQDAGRRVSGGARVLCGLYAQGLQSSLRLGLGSCRLGGFHGNDTPCPCETHSQDHGEGAQKEDQHDTGRRQEDNDDAAKEGRIAESLQCGLDDDEQRGNPEGDRAAEEDLEVARIEVVQEGRQFPLVVGRCGCRRVCIGLLQRGRIAVVRLFLLCRGASLSLA